MELMAEQGGCRFSINYVKGGEGLFREFFSKYLLSGEISRLFWSSSQQRLASANPLLVLARLLGHKISWEFS